MWLYFLGPFPSSLRVLFSDLCHFSQVVAVVCIFTFFFLNSQFHEIYNFDISEYPDLFMCDF